MTRSVAEDGHFYSQSPCHRFAPARWPPSPEWVAGFAGIRNLILSMLAAIQAPIIMMSQNRQATRDRLEAEVDHEVNVRAELAIHHLDARLHAIEQRLLDLSSILARSSASGSAFERPPTR